MTADVEPEIAPHGSVRGSLEVGMGLLVVLVLLATGLGFWGEAWWGFDLLSHFRLHYAGVSAAVLVVAVLRRRAWLLGGAVVALGVNLSLVVPLWAGGVAPDPARGPEAGRLRVVQYNVLRDNLQKAGLLAWVARQEADLVVLQEVDAAWIAAASAGLPGHRVLANAVPRDDNFGMAMFARAGLEVEGAVAQWDAAQVPRLEATVRVGGVAVRVLGVHTLPPIGAHYAAARGAQLRELAAQVNPVGDHAVVVGDLNATPWSAPYRRLMRETSLRSAAGGRGPRGTWPAGFGSWLGIPLDHVLFGPGLAAADHALAPASSSDHRGVVADLVVYPAAPAGGG